MIPSRVLRGKLRRSSSPLICWDAPHEPASCLAAPTCRPTRRRTAFCRWLRDPTRAAWTGVAGGVGRITSGFAERRSVLRAEGGGGTGLSAAGAAPSASPLRPVWLPNPLGCDSSHAHISVPSWRVIGSTAMSTKRPADTRRDDDHRPASASRALAGCPLGAQCRGRRCGRGGVRVPFGARASIFSDPHPETGWRDHTPAPLFMS